MTYRRYRRLALLALGLSFAGQSGVHAENADDETLWKQLDITEDGWLSGKELDGGWAKYNTDGNGEVTRAEFVAGRVKERQGNEADLRASDEKLFKELDISEDGYLSGKELEAGNARRYDANGDARVTREEFMAARVKLRQAAGDTKATTPQGTPASPPVTVEQPPAKLVLPLLQPRPGHAMGRVVDERGKPLSGVDVRIGGTTNAGERTSFDTKATNGRYAFPVPPGKYHIGAWVSVQYNGKPYYFRLQPVGDDVYHRDFDSKPGIVRDFVWKITGLMAGARADPDDAGSYYGGSLQLYGENPTLNYDPKPLEFPEGSTVAVTLTPNGALIDGSQGKALIFKLPLKTTRLAFVHYTKRTFKDIPIGRYTASATLTEPDGTVKPLRIAAKTDSTDVLAEDRLLGPPGTTASVDFFPRKERYSYGLNGVFGVSLYLMAS